MPTKFFVAKSVTTVRPSGENRTPEGRYEVSNLDQTVPYPIEVIFVFETETYNINVGEVLKQSLEKVLEEYYPLAGRLKMGCDGRMVVDCGGGEGGVLFVEAFSDEEVAVMMGDITGINPDLLSKLVYSYRRPYETILDVPPLTVQVTTFKCGGVVIGARFNHVFFDGIGFLDFIDSWSEIARGLPLSINPCLDRSKFFARKSPKIKFPHHEYSKIERPLTPLLTQGDKTTLTKSFRFSPTAVSRLRESGNNNNNNDDDKGGPVRRAPTAFEVISALAWICWTRAKKLSPGETSQIVMAVDGRHKLRPPLAEGYFGNCLVWACARSTAREVTSQPFSCAVEMVRDALDEVTEDYLRSAIDFHQLSGRPLEVENTMWITKWSRLPFYDLDFGWGGPSKVFPGAVLENLVVLFSEEKDSKNQVVSVSLPAEAMEIFEGLIESHLNHNN